MIDKNKTSIVLQYVYENIHIVIFSRYESHGIGVPKKTNFYLKVKKFREFDILIRRGRITSEERHRIFDILRERMLLVQYCMNITLKFKQHTVYLQLNQEA